MASSSRCHSGVVCLAILLVITFSNILIPAEAAKMLLVGTNSTIEFRTNKDDSNTWQTITATSKDTLTFSDNVKVSGSLYAGSQTTDVMTILTRPKDVLSLISTSVSSPTVGTALPNWFTSFASNVNSSGITYESDTGRIVITRPSALGNGTATYQIRSELFIYSTSWVSYQIYDISAAAYCGNAAYRIPASATTINQAEVGVATCYTSVSNGQTKKFEVRPTGSGTTFSIRDTYSSFIAQQL